jgi:hypothetical protein
MEMTCDDLFCRQKFARYLFYLNLLTYILFVILMMIFIFTVATPIRTVNIDDVNYCPITLPANQAKNTSLLNYYKVVGTVFTVISRYSLSNMCLLYATDISRLLVHHTKLARLHGLLLVLSQACGFPATGAGDCCRVYTQITRLQLALILMLHISAKWRK